MIGQLRLLGLTEYETKVYLCLLEQGPLSGGQVSKHSGVPHGKSYESLASLDEKGFVSVTPTKPKIFKAINPTIAVTHTIREKIENLRDSGQKLVRTLQNIHPYHKQPSIEEKVIIIKGIKKVKTILAYNFHVAQRWIKETRTFEYLPPAILALEKEAWKRGVKHQIIATKMGERELKLMKEYVKKGVEVRYYPLEELRIQIVDGKILQQHFVNPVNLIDRMVLFTENKELAHALEVYFDMLWMKAHKINLKTQLQNI